MHCRFAGADERIGGTGAHRGQVADYHQYPIADNAAPALSADRLEYTLGNLLNYGFADRETVSAFYRDLTVGTDEHGREELVFQTPEIAEAFASAALQNSRVYVADEDRLAMQMLADLLQTALQRGILRREDIWQTEPWVIRAAGDRCGMRRGMAAVLRELPGRTQ